MSKSLDPRRGHFESPKKRGPERRTVFKDWRNMCSTGLETRRRVRPRTRTTQSFGHITAATETLKAATKVLVQGKRSLLLKNFIAKEHPHVGWNHCQEVKTVREDTGSQNPSGISQALRTICPNRGKNASKIRSKSTTSVNADGLRVCLDKVEAVLSFPSPKCLKDVQRLNRKLASLSRFLSISAEKSFPFFKTLKKCAKKKKEELVIYLAAAKEAVSAVLMKERDEKKMPIYFVIRALQGPKINYTLMKKLTLALMLSSPEVAERLLKWRFELEGHDIHYRPRTSVKGQILADFIVERPKDNPQDTPMEDEEALLDPWILFTDGSSCIDEYEALIADLRIAEEMGVKNLQANVDSKLVANQVNEIYIAKEPDMIKYLEKVKALTSTFKEFFIKQ
nr:hypothetical protein [Tanacetum cinerariifolium]